MWIRALDFFPLQVIQFSHCPNVENILAYMAKDNRPSQLQSLTIYHHVPANTIIHCLSAALARVLEKSSPPSKLILHSEELPTPPSQEHIAIHDNSLETLLLHRDGPNRYSPEEIKKSTKYTGDRLRQLGFIIDDD